MLDICRAERSELNHLESICARIAATTALQSHSLEDLERTTAGPGQVAFADGTFASKLHNANADVERLAAAVSRERQRLAEIAAPTPDETAS